MQIPVNQIVNVEPNSYQGLTKTTFLSSASNNQPVYMLHQPQNSPQPGTMLDGTINTDRAGKLKYTKTPNPQYQNQGSSNFQQPAMTGFQPSAPQSASSYQPSSMPSSDPRQESIEKQAYFKAAIDLYGLWKTSGTDKSLRDFTAEVVETAISIRKQMATNKPISSDDVILKDIPSDTDMMANLAEAFGPGTAEVLNEGPNGL